MLTFLAGDSELTQRIRRHDWRATSLGDPAGWPPALKTLVGVMLEANQPMFVVWGPEQRLLYNDRYISVLQGHHPQALGRPFLEVWSEIADDLGPLVADAYAGRASHMDDILLMMERNGFPEETHFAYSYTPVRHQGGGVDGFFCACIETTEQVRAARIIRESEVRNRQVFDSAIDYAIVATNLDGLVTSWNEGARRILGWTEDEMLGRPIDCFFTPEDRERDRPRVEMEGALKSGRADDERWHLRKNGQRFFASGEMTPLRDADGGAVGFVKVLRDRTEQRQADEALATSRAELDRALAALRALNETLEVQVVERTAERDRMWEICPDLMLVIDFEGVFRRVNPAWTTVLGYAADELVGHHVNEFVIVDDHRETIDAYEFAAAGGSPRIENRYRHKDGTTRRISWVAAPAGAFTYATGRDVTAEREAADALHRAEDQLRQAQKVEAVGQLTGGVAHDFNNLLTVIRGSVDLLRRPNITDERRTRYIDAIADTTDRAARLTNQLLAFARRQALTPVVFDAAESVRSIREMMGTLSGPLVTVQVDASSGPCLVSADRNQFDTALINMAVNARDAMSGQGTLSLRVRPVPSMPAVRAHPAVPGQFIAISLADTGDGIPADQIDRIFEPFFTTKGVGQGTGLGLSQVFGFAKQSGGEVMVESEPGRGAVFTLYLPLAQGAFDAEPAEQVLAETHSGEGACILVVEDNAEVGAFARSALAELGYSTVLAPDAAHALGELDAAHERFDAIFSDVVMPGMSGIELAQEVQRRYRGMPVILTSGYSTVLALEGSHGFELIHKPYSIEQLSRALQKVVARRRGGKATVG